MRERHHRERFENAASKRSSCPEPEKPADGWFIAHAEVERDGAVLRVPAEMWELRCVTQSHSPSERDADRARARTHQKNVVSVETQPMTSRIAAYAANSVCPCCATRATAALTAPTAMMMHGAKTPFMTSTLRRGRGLRYASAAVCARASADPSELMLRVDTGVDQARRSRSVGHSSLPRGLEASSASFLCSQNSSSKPSAARDEPGRR